MAFKVKTTAPKQYCVRPNSGKIEPGQAVDVSVVLQPMREDPPPDARCRDKFLVQSVLVPGSKDMSNWSSIEQNYKADIQERKIRVHYLPAEGSSPQTNGVDDHHADESTTMISPPPSYAAPAHVADDVSSRADSRAAEVSSAVEETHGASRQQSSLSREELQHQLAEANATITRLRRELDEQGTLRQRKGDAGEGLAHGGVSMGVPTQQHIQGMSVQNVAILCLIVFLLTYILF